MSINQKEKNSAGGCSQRPRDLPLSDDGVHHFRKTRTPIKELQINVKPVDLPSNLTHNTQHQFTIQPCKQKNCKTCASLNTLKSFHSNFNGRTYSIEAAVDLTCSTNNVIYLVTCIRCGFQYVGKTEQPLHRRMCGHRANIRAKKLLIGEHFGQHFNKDHIFQFKL